MGYVFSRRSFWVSSLRNFMDGDCMSELKPCPFCGGEAETWDGAGPWHVVCTECGTIGSPCLSEAEAITAWNSRVERTCIREKHGVKMDGSPRLRCSLCGYGLGDKRFNYCPNCGAKVVGE